MRARRKQTALGLGLAFTLFASSVAIADDVVVDGDDITADGTLDFGTVCVDDDVSSAVAVTADRQGGGAQVWANGSTLAITTVAPPGTTASSASLSLPGDWVTTNQTADNAKTAGPVDVVVALDTSTPRVVLGNLTVTATGPRHSGSGDLSKSRVLGVAGTVEACTPADTTAPVITPSISGPLGDNGWYVGDVAVSWTVVDDESAVVSESGCETTTVDEDTSARVLTCTAASSGGSHSESVTIKRDASPPTILASRSPAANADGWNNETVAVSFLCDDAMSGVVSCGPDGEVATEGADQTMSGTAVDAAGNTATATVSGISVDLTSPTVWLMGGPEDGTTYYPHEMAGMAAPTCAASDTLSGLDGTCAVNGFATTTGAHTVTASVSDLAGNGATTSRTFTVAPYTVSGFYSPVDMGGTWNTVKGGSTVPLKFEVFAGATEMTSTSVVVTPLTALRVGCSGGVEDAIEVTATGGTALRYDSTGGQFIYNWQTPKGAGQCYTVTVALVGGQVITANFKTK